MKKVNRLYINKKWQRALGIICLLGLILTSIVFLTDSLQEKKEVSAHPTNTIKLDEGGSNEFDLPVDAQQLEEQAIRDLGTFDEYVQGKDQVPIMEKQIVRSYGSPAGSNGQIISCSIMDVEKTTNGNYFVLFQIHGSGSGGIVRTAVYDKKGQQLAVNNYGTKNDANFRINSKLFNKSGNNFLVGVFSNRFLRYTVSEAGNSATIQRTLFTTAQTPGNPSNEIGTDYVQIIDQFSGYSNEALVIGRATYGNSSISGTYKKRLSVGAINTNGWLTSGFDADSRYDCTLQTLLIQEDLNLSEMYTLTVIGNRGPGSIFKRNGFIFGTFGYATSKGDGEGFALNTFQVFSNEDIDDTEVLDNGGERPKRVKKRVYQHRDSSTIYQDTLNGKFFSYEVVKNLCTDEAIYYFATDDEKKELIKVDLTTFDDEVIKTYPRDSGLNFYPDGSGNFTFYGTTNELSGEFYSDHYTNKLNSPYYFISGVMNGITGTTEDLKVKSLRAIGVEGFVSPAFAIEGEDNEIFIAGQTGDNDIFPTYKYLIDETEPDYTREDGTPSGNSAFVGTLKIKDDYSSIIKKVPSIVVDMTDEAMTNATPTGYMNWNSLDRWLITGTKNGTVTSPEAIKVYDHFDSNDSQIGATAAEREEWLQKRINRNPKDLSAEIEWEKLGFDKNKVGPQLVTYFVTDTQNQPAVTSRWVNALGEETKTDDEDKFALDVQNFHIPIEEVTKPAFNEEAVKKLAKTLAWNLNNNESSTGDHGNGLDEDGAADKFSTTKVEVNATQLAALQAATVAKPYPVDITYKPEAGIEITNRVWVFVTTDNTVANTETGIVYYADDYAIPYRLRGNHDLEAILTHGNVKAYNYYAKDTTAELAALPNSTSGTSNWSISNHNVIQDPFSGGPVTLPLTVKPELTYTWNATTDHYHTNGETTEGSLDVTLTGNVLLHVRQVIQTPTDEIIVPTEGYLTLQTILNNGGNPALDPDYQSQMTISSGKQADNPNFSTWGVDIEQLVDGADQVKLTPIIPEFYQYNGYYASNEKASHNDNSLNAPNNTVLTQSYLYEEGELWITLYLEPNGTNNGKPQPYSWDYKHNDLGKITE